MEGKRVKKIDFSQKSHKILFLIIIIALLALLTKGLSSGFFFRNTSPIKLYGNIDIRDVSLGFRVFGRLEKMLFEEGDRVKAGEVMAVLDKRPYQDALQAATADVEQKRVAHKNAVRIASRREALVKTQATSKEEAETTQATRDQSLAAFHVSEANRDTAQTNLNDTEILAPSNGVILSRIKEPGSILNPGDSVYILSLDEPIWARVYVSEPDLGRIFIGMKAKVYTDSQPDKPYEGQIGFISPTAEFTTKTVETEELRTKLVYRLRVIIPKPDALLKQGMPVTVVIDPQQTLPHAN